MSSPRLRAHEDRFISLLRTMFSGWLGLANNAVLSLTRRLQSQPDPTGVFAVSSEWDRMVRNVAIPDLTAAAAIGWSEAFQQPVFSSTNSHIVGALAGSENLLRNIPGEVHAMIVEDLSVGLSNGLSRQEIIDRIDQTLSLTGSPRWLNRASLIATTETTRAANAGALAAAIQAEQTLGPLTKQWNDSKDHRVRETHEQIDGTRLPLMQPFIVGGFPLMYPSEPFGPPEEVIGCRCDLSFRRMDQ